MRGRRPAIIPTSALTVQIPQLLRDRMDLLLWSEAEHRVPWGAYQRLFTQLLNDYFENKPLDISRFLDKPAGTHVVVGPTSTIAALLHQLSTTKEPSP